MRHFLAHNPENRQLWLVNPPNTHVIPDLRITELSVLTLEGCSFQFLPWLHFLRPEVLILPSLRIDAYVRDVIRLIPPLAQLRDIHITFDPVEHCVDKREIFVFLLITLRNVRKTLHFASNDIDFAEPQYFRRNYAHVLENYKYFETYIVRYFGIVWDEVFVGPNALSLRNYS